ncbi:MAG: GxxExxY protein [Bacteroidota bacterium]
MKKKPFLHAELSDKVIGAFYKVYNSLGYGFVESVYQNALALELQTLGLEVKKESSIEVFYRGEVIGSFRADLIINDLILLELKSSSSIIDAHILQLNNYLSATNIELGFVFNFGEKPKFKRRVFDNSRKLLLKKVG